MTIVKVLPVAEDGDDKGAATVDRTGAERTRWPLHWRIVTGLVLGAIAGSAARGIWPPEESSVVPFVAQQIAYPLGQIFLRLIFMVVVPLVVVAIVLGVNALKDLRQLGSVGLRTFLYTLLLSSLSVAIGLAVANILAPGERIAPDERNRLKELVLGRQEVQLAEETARRAKSPMEVVLDLIPRNPLQEMVGALDGSSPGGGMLAVMVFALILGMALTRIGDKGKVVLDGCEGLFEALLTIVHWAMRIAPLGVAALLFHVTAFLGPNILLSLGWYVAAVLIGLSVHGGVVYPLVLRLLARASPRRFFAGASEAMLTAFATSSSNATLPTALRVAEERLRLDAGVSRFVLTVGATANQNGTALYEGVTVLFLAQLFQVELTLTQQLTVVLMCVLAGIGTAGVPGGSLPLLAAVLLAVGVPTEGLAIILGVDRLLDMCRTALNVTGDLVIATWVQASLVPRAADRS